MVIHGYMKYSCHRNSSKVGKWRVRAVQLVSTSLCYIVIEDCYNLLTITYYIIITFIYFYVLFKSLRDNKFIYNDVYCCHMDLESTINVYKLKYN